MRARVKLTENNGDLFQEFQKQSPKCVLLKRCSLFLKDTFGRLLLGFLWGTASGKIVKWQESHFKRTFPNVPKAVLQWCSSKKVFIPLQKIYHNRGFLLSVFSLIRTES